MRCYFPIAKVDAEARMVWGYASTEARDDQGETVTVEALKAALGDYMKFANIREMHQLSAVGVAREAAVDDRGLYIGARIVDGRAWEKVTEGVYKGFSIGGRVTARDTVERNTITGLAINEISLVDRPANPEAVFDYWKASTRESEAMAFNIPIQLWACGVADHRHLAKADAVKCIAEREAPSDAEAAIAPVSKALARAEDAAGPARPDTTAEKPYGEVDYADPGYQLDGRKRYPIDTAAHIRAAWAYINRPRNQKKYTADQLKRIRERIIAAWREKIDREGPPAAADGAKAATAALRKALSDVGRIAELIQSLDWVRESLEAEAAIEGDDSPQPARLREIVGELCDFLDALVAEETAELVEDEDVAPQSVMTVAGAAGGRVLQALRKSGRSGLAERMAGAPAAPQTGDHDAGRDRAAAAAQLARVPEDGHVDQAPLVKLLAEIVPRLDRLAKRVEDIATTPLPPLTMARPAHLSAVSKERDGAAGGLSTEEVAAAFAKMSSEEQTLTLIKASYQRPMRLPGITDPAERGER
jgi:phage head maturation protease